MPGASAELGIIGSLDELAGLVERSSDLYVRWSRGPDVDGDASRDELSGVELPGLCANPLAVEEWWGDRPVRVWVARRLFDYRHLAAPGVQPWILEGEEAGRGPDNEPLVRYRRALAWVSDAAVAEAEEVVADEARNPDRWGSLKRS